MARAVLERALDVEIADHLGFGHSDPAGYGWGNSRNGHGRKNVLTTAGPVELVVPRDRIGTFTPATWPERRRCLSQVEDMILSLYARGMSTRDITEHLAQVYGASVSAATISRVTDVVTEEIAAWQLRPVDPGRFPAIVANPGWMGLRCLGMRRTRCLPVSSADTSN